MPRLHHFRLLSLVVLVTLVLGGHSAVASPLPDAPYVGEFTFSTGFDPDTNTPINPGTQFGPNTPSLHVSFEFDGMWEGRPYTALWYWEKVPFVLRSGEFESDKGVMVDRLDSTNGSHLPEGRYDFSIFFGIDTELSGWCEIRRSYSPVEPPPIGEGLPHIGDVTFSTDFDWDTLTPIDPGTRFDSDTVRLYVSWEYSGATVGTAFKGIWTPAGDWSDARGEFARTEGVMATAITTSDGQPLPEGVYGFSGIVNGEELFYDECVVGDAPGPDEPAPIEDGLPAFGPVSVTSEYDEALEEPVGSESRFDEGVTRLYFYCSFENMPDGAQGITTVYHDQGDVYEFLYQSDLVFDFPAGMWWEEVENPDGSPLAPGKYKVIFEVDGRVAAKGDCVVGDASGPPSPEPSGRVTREYEYGWQRPIISYIVFGEDVTDEGRVIGASDSFPAGTTEVWVYFTHLNTEDGLIWGYRLEQNGEVFQEERDLVWEYGGDGWLGVQLADGSSPLEGEYQLTLEVEGRLVPDQASFTVGMTAATEPTETPVESLPTPDIPGLVLFGPIHFTTEFDAEQDRPVGSVSVVEPGIDHFYAYAEIEMLKLPKLTGLQTTAYYVDNADERVCTGGEYYRGSYTGVWWQEIRDMHADELRPGTYRVVVSVEDQKLGEGELAVGSVH